MGEILKSSRFWISVVICIALALFVLFGKMGAELAIGWMIGLANGFGVGKAGGNARLDKLIADGVRAGLEPKDLPVDEKPAESEDKPTEEG